MGHLRSGEWHNDEVVTSDEQGAFDREESVFRERIGGASDFQPASGRYHLYVSFACPWAHRTLIARKLKKLDQHISVSVVHPHMLEYSWTFRQDFDGATGDPLYGLDYLYQIYQRHDPEVTTKVTVPVLWDKKLEKIVNNESSEILRIFNADLAGLAGDDTPDLYPEAHRDEIDAINERVYHDVNNGVYKAGFAKTQASYDAAFSALFETMHWLEERLSSREFLVGDHITEADVRLLTTLLRFDAVYFGHFKCNLKRLVDFPSLSRYARRLYALDAVQSTTRFDHIQQHYYYSHEFLNPNRIVPNGPERFV